MSTFGSHPIELILIAMLSGGLGMPPSIPPLPEDVSPARTYKQRKSITAQTQNTGKN